MKRRPFSIRLSISESDEIANAADGAGLALGTFIRGAALANARRSPSPRQMMRDRLAVSVAQAAGMLGVVADGNSDTDVVGRLEEVRAALDGLVREGAAR